MKTWMILIIGITLGGLSGFLYWYYVGCYSGTCAITSSPVNSTLYGSLMGGLLINIFKRSDKNTAQDDHQ